MPAELEQARAATKAAQRAPGPAQQLAETVGTQRGGEAIYRGLDNDLKGGATADNRTAMNTWNAMSPVDKAQFRGAWLRNLGKDAAGNFSLERFVKDWGSYSDAGKGMILDVAHRQHLNDFRTMAKEYSEAVKKYGNVSGTTQTTNWAKLLAAIPGMIAAPKLVLATLAGGVGLYGVSKLLASPRGTQQMVRWNRLAQAYQRAPTAGKLNALSNVSRIVQGMAGQ
jgi:hypothetical protein